MKESNKNINKYNTYKNNNNDNKIIVIKFY